ncbi:MAG: dCTP deaminase [Candidatus Gracilibacteria bacterium]|nr:dCTP deaminase [Candidatus Gracilibacteria bacterium]
MILADSEIIKRLESGNIELIPTNGIIYDNRQVGPASLDFRLGNVFKSYKRDNLTVIDPKIGVDEKHVETIRIPDGEAFILHPRQFVLGVTREKIKLPTDLVARCEGRSSIGRLGVIIHSTAGFIDPGFEGTITLEITNINEVPIALYPGMRIGQFAFELLEGEVINSYDKRKGSKYMGQIEPEISRIALDIY